MTASGSPDRRLAELMRDLNDALRATDSALYKQLPSKFRRDLVIHYAGPFGVIAKSSAFRARG
jgi:hypothetical protein